MAKKNYTRLILAYSTIGIQLAVTLLLFLFLGHWLDERYGSSPWFILLGTVLGMGVGFYNLMKSLSELDRMLKTGSEDDQGDQTGNKDRRKWM
ncbi:MAG: AtpZ/AtpI family protein [Bacteroidales bacterium]